MAEELAGEAAAGRGLLILSYHTSYILPCRKMVYTFANGGRHFFANTVVRKVISIAFFSKVKKFRVREDNRKVFQSRI